jgi:hypothetical protein
MLYVSGAITIADRPRAAEELLFRAYQEGLASLPPTNKSGLHRLDA